MIMTVLRQQPRAAGLVLGLIAANLLAWCWALQAFGDSGALMAASLLAWGYGLRHAVDADHIAAIDNVTRKMMQQGRRPFAVGAWFSGPLIDCGAGLGSDCRYRHGLQRADELAARHR